MDEPTTTPHSSSLQAMDEFVAALRRVVADSKLETRGDGVVAAVHALFIAQGLSLAGVGEDQTIAAADSVEALPSGWNASKDNYTLRYEVPTRGTSLLLTATSTGTHIKLSAFSACLEDTPTCELAIAEYTLPEPVLTNADRLYTLSLYKLVEVVTQRLLQPLDAAAPAPLTKPPGARSKAPATDKPRGDLPVGDGPSSLRIEGSGSAGRNPYSIGDADRLPPPFRADGTMGIGGGAGGGMIVGPDHPMFQDRGGIGGGIGGGHLPYPGHGPRLPPGSHPPGARWDPMTPFPGAGLGPPPPRPGRGGGPPGGPDFDHFAPPGSSGYGDMFM